MIVRRKQEPWALLERTFWREKRNRVISRAWWRSIITELSGSRSAVCSLEGALCRATSCIAHVTRAREGVSVRARGKVMYAARASAFFASRPRELNLTPDRSISACRGNRRQLSLFLSYCLRAPNNAADRWKSVRHVKRALQNRARHMAFVASDAAAAAEATAAAVCLGRSCLAFSHSFPVIWAEKGFAALANAYYKGREK